MKKTLIAVAALAAVGAASAQSSVTLYGVADVYAGQTKTTLTLPGMGPVNVATQGLPMRTIVTKNTGFKSGGLQGSRLGVKGVEDLGNGLKAVFNYEMGFDAINGNGYSSVKFDGEDYKTNGLAFNRRAVVGLQGGFGSVLLGTDYTPLFNLLDASSVDALSSFETVSSHIYTPRASGVHYAGNFAGVGVQAFAGYNKESTTRTTLSSSRNRTTKTQGYGLGVSYANGPFMVGVAGQEFKDTESRNSPWSASSEQLKRTEAAVGATYDFGVAKLFANYINTRVRYAEDGAGQFKVKGEEANIGVRVPFGAASVMAGYGHNRVKLYDGAGTQLGKAKGNDWVVGANYAFSKRTDVYARVGRSDDLKAKATINGREFDVGSYKTENVAVGLRHKF